MSDKLLIAPVKGRGAGENPAGRFEKLRYEFIAEDSIMEGDELPPSPKTLLLKDDSKSIVASNDSPDIGFDLSVNPYRGCEHGCIYCYARPSHEFLGFSAGMDFETKILVKEKAPELLREKLASKTWEPKLIAMSGVTDCYQPVERQLKLTRRCLEVLLDFRNPVFIITKNSLVTRDIDVLKKLAEFEAAAVMVSVTTLDSDLCSVMEPRTSHPKKRLEAIAKLAEAGVPVGVNVSPCIPGLTDHEIPSILKEAYAAGARMAGFQPVRLPYGVAPLFEKWLETHRPDSKGKVLNRIRSVRGGRLNDPEFGSRMRGEGIFAEQMRAIFNLHTRRLGYLKDKTALCTKHFRRPTQVGEQLGLFDVS